MHYTLHAARSPPSKLLHRRRCYPALTRPTLRPAMRCPVLPHALPHCMRVPECAFRTLCEPHMVLRGLHTPHALRFAPGPHPVCTMHRTRVPYRTVHPTRVHPTRVHRTWCYVGYTRPESPPTFSSDSIRLAIHMSRWRLRGGGHVAYGTSRHGDVAYDTWQREGRSSASIRLRGGADVGTAKGGRVPQCSRMPQSKGKEHRTVWPFNP